MPNGIRAVLITRTLRRPNHNTLYYHPDIPPTRQAHIKAIANQIDSHFRAALEGCLTDACKVVAVAAYYNGPADLFLEATSSTGETAGTGGGDDNEAVDTLPDETAAVIRKLTGLAGREDRGRLFISGLPESYNDEGLLNTDGQTAVKAFANLIPGDIDIEYEYNPSNGEVSEDSFATQIHARHWNRKENVLRPIIGCLTNTVLMSRADRRAPLRALGV